MTCAFCGASLPVGAMFCGECGHGVSEAPPAPEIDRECATAVEREAAPAVDSVPDTTPATEDPREADPVSEPPRERFILHFSTGESVQVTASGLIGRNPHPEPGEAFDMLVAIVDPGKSVSKTHLEFGHADGWFWVSDRYSGNGTVLREPGTEPRRCEPGRRYRVPRGSRVDLGDQFMIVS